jgi:hypothetical protein
MWLNFLLQESEEGNGQLSPTKPNPSQSTSTVNLPTIQKKKDENHSHPHRSYSIPLQGDGAILSSASPHSRMTIPNKPTAIVTKEVEDESEVDLLSVRQVAPSPVLYPRNDP